MENKKNVNAIIGKASATVYAYHPKTFLKVVDDIGCTECGVAFIKKGESETLVKCDSLETTIATYKRVIDMVDLNEVEQLRIGKNLLNKLKEKAITFDYGTCLSLVCCGLLLGDNNPKYWNFILITLLLSSVNITKVVTLLYKAFSKPEDRAQLEADLAALGVLAQAIDCENKDEVSLYVKSDFGSSKTI